ncbi:mediator complex subunit MED14-domain-containing protein [Multifurca ochricompacta]|uniref:Mediator of RNA polymerase II transcription subunit 14 n=1 Tax=Multifurca ochricompacta TaxID=376703 RepID=A0AAD4QLG8_9AGAM|nr:mediator complex subunit MED14-domain-containing protein [Multifurca ochricompacta]
MALNGTNLTASSSYSSPILDILNPSPNCFDEPPIELLAAELPVVDDGQVPLSELVSRVVQACYAEMTEMAETLPGMSDSARKRKLADFVVAWKKQVVKLYAVTKWSRDADIVQKCMNITAFLMDQNRQFDDVIHGLTYARDSLDGARLRNHDLLTSLDVLTTGSYRRLPTMIKKTIIPPSRLTDTEVSKILSDLEALTRFRLRMTEIIPVEMFNYRICMSLHLYMLTADGRAWFTVPNLFETSICLRGGNQEDGWFFVHVEFLFTVGGDRTGMQEFPRKPTGVLKEHLTIEADNRLGYYLPIPEPEQPPDPNLPPPLERPKLPEDVADAPLVRIYNFLQMMSMSYQLEVLWYQAERLRSLGWGDFLKVEMARDRKALSVSYWIRQLPARPPPLAARFQLPLLGGTLKIELQSTPHPIRKPHARVLAELQDRAKLGGRRPSDTVEGTRWNIVWDPAPRALGIALTVEGPIPELSVVYASFDLDFERLIRTVIETHTHAIFREFSLRLLNNPVFSLPGAVVVVEEAGSQALHVYLCADEIVVVTIEPRTGKISLRDTGDLGAAGRGPRFLAISEKLNENPTVLLEALTRLRINTIVELAEQKANYLGFQTFRQRNFSREEFIKFGTTVRSLLYIQLTPFPTHYLVLVVTDTDFRYALISVKIVPDSMYQTLVMEDIGWLDVERICGRSREARAHRATREPGFGGPGAEFRLETLVLRELYTYCCARVAHTKVEKQLKRLNIPYSHVYPPSPTVPVAPVNAAGTGLPATLGPLHSTLSHTIPALLIQSSDVLRNSAARDAAMPNIRVVPLAWWVPGASAKGPKVVTCVKLRHVQELVGRRVTTASASRGVLRPSKHIVYDAHEAVVCFLSDEVDGCMDEFKDGWESVSKIVVIAREVVNMAKEKQWEDVRLLSFDLQTVEFTYASDYTLSISCKDQLLTGGSYHLHFGRLHLPAQDEAHHHRPNPHSKAEPFFHALLRHGRLADALPAMVSVLRDTVPILEVLTHITPARAVPKAAGWWRVMFNPAGITGGVARHALDFRVLKGSRMALLDASQSLFRSAPPQQSTPASGSQSQSQQQDGTQCAIAVGFLPIPGLDRAIADAVVAGRGRGTVAGIDIGVVCSTADVVIVGEALWEGIMRYSGLGGEVVVKMEEGA